LGFTNFNPNLFNSKSATILGSRDPGELGKEALYPEKNSYSVHIPPTLERCSKTKTFKPAFAR